MCNYASFLLELSHEPKFGKMYGGADLIGAI